MSDVNNMTYVNNMSYVCSLYELYGLCKWYEYFHGSLKSLRFCLKKTVKFFVNM